ncbi:SpoIIE family protein phosphatase [Streptomyces turgidiscabies]|uniref:protein-serine/threonine phosphatase n=1 Tax=Streptomyces turgidiscabies (strain Car8) TaxID=698760 RepID=L7F1E4_STRT8|nr:MULTISPECIES: SpoIIE family protein phosphatase [Streptomyces]ELP64974.1 stage II sporulation protein E [Streptomyces turgidiscabies Car8]MDX3498230.1 SpoIIE family protein phosphatase [Streptomyces turgidiscabies]GAQ75203.1 phosphoserine phosphatase RsbU [Streptomyces turgidiscabies]
MAGPEHTDIHGKRPLAPPAAGLVETLEAFGTGAYIVDVQGRIIAVNSRAEQILDRSAGDLFGHDAHDLLHRDAHGHPLPRTQCRMRQAFHARRTAQAEEDYFARGDGSLLPISWLITPFDLGAHDLDEYEHSTLVIFHPRHPRAPSLPQPEAALLPEIERLALLAATTTQLTSTLDVEEALRRLVTLVVPRLADWAIIDLITERDEVWRTVVAEARDDGLVHHEELQGPMPPVPEESPMPLSRALRGVASTLAGPQTYQGPPDSGIAVEQRRLFDVTGIHSAAIAPIRSTRAVLGALTLGRAKQPGDFATVDLPLIEDIARRAGLALDNARLYQRQRKVAETMQNHLLPQMPRVPGLQMTVRYLPAPDASQVGGDWYDAFSLADGATALAIGDVVGHDLEAAAGMAQVRNMLRAYAWALQEPPSRIVERLDEAVLHITDVAMATMILARVEETHDGQWKLTWTNAGHPPPLLISHDGLADYLTDGHGILLGTGAHRPRSDATALLPPGSTLLLYTDGLIEEPGHTLDEGLNRLRRHAAALAHRPLTSFIDQMLSRVRPVANDDDVALLALRVPTRP